jgi:putative membrane protein
MTANIRDLTRHIWLDMKLHDTKSVIGKKSAINLLVAFAISTKHYLREEYSYDQPDLKRLISHLPVFNIPSSNLSMSYQDQFVDEEGDSNGPQQHGIISSLLRRICCCCCFRKIKKRSSFIRDPYKARDAVTPTNIPIEVSYYIASYINWCREHNKCDPSIIIAMQSGK